MNHAGNVGAQQVSESVGVHIRFIASSYTANMAIEVSAEICSSALTSWLLCVETW